MCEVCLKLKIKTSERHHWRHSHGVFLVNFEKISAILLDFLLLTLNKWMGGMTLPGMQQNVSFLYHLISIKRFLRFLLKYIQLKSSMWKGVLSTFPYRSKKICALFKEEIGTINTRITCYYTFYVTILVIHKKPSKAYF